MGGDGRCNIAGEVLVDGCRGVGGQQGDALLDGAARRRGCAQNRNRGRSVLNDDFGSGSDVRHQPGKVAGGVELRDVDRCHTQDHTSVWNGLHCFQ